jgi:hypothetical protein
MYTGRDNGACALALREKRLPGLLLFIVRVSLLTRTLTQREACIKNAKKRAQKERPKERKKQKACHLLEP